MTLKASRTRTSPIPHRLLRLGPNILGFLNGGLRFKAAHYLLKAVSLRVRNLERGAGRVDSTLATSFEGVRFELDDV